MGPSKVFPSPMHTVILLITLSWIGLDAVKVDLFRDLNYKGLIYEYRSGLPDCHDVEEYGRGDIGSIKSDSCLMIYEQPSCQGSSFKVSRDNPDVANLRRSISSFHVCNATFGGDTIRVDMFDTNDNPIAKYKDVCGCQDLPTQVTTNLFKLNNYGNCITVYATDSCSGTQKEEIPAGQNGFTQNLPSLGYFVRSISGCGTRRSCVKLSSKIFKFVLFSADSNGDSVDQPGAREAELGSKTSFINNGRAILTQVYEARRSVNETSTMSMSKSLTSMSYSEINVGFSVEAKLSMTFPGVEDPKKAIGSLSASVGASLGIGYKDVIELGSTEGGSFTHSKEKEYVVRQSFEVPPCTKYDVSSIVTIVENYPIIYEVYMMVTGESSGERLTAEEVAEQVDELTFVENYDEYTAIFKTAEKLVANMGVETVITGEGQPIPGCRRERPDLEDLF